jgi:uncharacterized protein YndB with AHSA1/START domain
MEPTKQSTTGQGARKTFTIERSFDASIEDVWDLWTTKDGIEAWWGPEGYQVEVRSIDLRAGGELVYAMTAVAPPQVEFMKKAGMPLTTLTKATYTEISKHRRLAFTMLADFVPGVTPYVVATLVEIHPAPNGVRMVITQDAMHDEQWSKMAKMGRESELDRLAKLLAQRRQRD